MFPRMGVSVTEVGSSAQVSSAWEEVTIEMGIRRSRVGTTPMSREGGKSDSE